MSNAFVSFRIEKEGYEPLELALFSLNLGGDDIPLTVHPPVLIEGFIFDGGHVPPQQATMAETLAWFDKYLGPVTPSR